MQRFDDEGRPQPLAGNAPLLLDAAGQVYRVAEGAVDLFLVALEAGAPAGQRHHVHRVEAGGLLLGLDGERLAPGWGLLAVGGPGSRLQALARERLADPGLAAELVPLIEAWVSGLTEPLRRQRPPKQVKTLEPGAVLALPAGTAALPREGVLWVRAQAGEALLLGQPGLAVGDGRLPLPDHLWLQAQGKVELSAVGGGDWLAQDPQWTALDHFHRLAFKALRGWLEAAGEEEGQRLRQRQANEQASVAGALQALTAIVGRPRAGGAPAAEGDRLLAACRRVGEAAHIRIVPHPAALRGGVQLDPLANIARASHIRLRRVALKGRWWQQDAGPLLGYLEDGGEPVALLPRPDGLSYELHDPASGRVSRVDAELAGRLQGFAYSFYRSFGEQALDLLGILRFGAVGRRRDMLTIGLMGVLVGVLGLLTPVATGQLIDSVIPSADHGQLAQLTLALIAVAFGSAMFELTRGFAQLRLEGKMDAGLQSAVWDRLLTLPASFFRQYSAGDLAMRANGITEIRRTLAGTTLSSMLSALFSVLSLGLMFAYSATLAWIGLGLVALAIAISAGLSWVTLRHERRLAEVEGRISGLVLQLLGGVAKLRASGAETRAFARWSRAFGEQQTLAFKAENSRNVVQVVNAVYPLLTSMVFFAAMAFLLGPDGLTTGQFLAFNAAAGTFTGAMVGLTNTVIGVLGIVPIYERAKPILQGVPEVDAAKADPGQLEGGIEVANVSFAYAPDQPLILDNVSLQIHPGEFVALVGPSGSGKSTLLRLLLGFEQPRAGSIYYDGQDLAGLDVGAVRRQLGVVLQNGVLMAGDIFTNIVGSAPLSLRDAEAAARMCGLDEDIKAMPMGMHTVVSDGGGTLSGGQRQRLLIARAIVTRPRILYFDEATSALDNRTQAIVSASLERLQATRVVVAHRLSTVVNADRIVVLQGGRIVQQGRYDELIQQGGLFAELARRQVA